MARMYQRVMLTTDGSELANAALPHAVALARNSGATLLLLAATDSLDELLAEGNPTGWLDLGGGLSEDDARAALRRQHEAATRHLEELAATIEDAPPVELHVVDGPAAHAIVDAATTLNADVIVIATHGRSGLRRALLGSVADHVLHHAACPVLLVRPTEGSPG
jgi:nucleotide-binding universal stress UspA family protein